MLGYVVERSASIRISTPFPTRRFRLPSILFYLPRAEHRAHEIEFWTDQSILSGRPALCFIQLRFQMLLVSPFLASSHLRRCILRTRAFLASKNVRAVRFTATKSSLFACSSIASESASFRLAQRRPPRRLGLMLHLVSFPTRLGIKPNRSSIEPKDLLPC